MPKRLNKYLLVIGNPLQLSEIKTLNIDAKSPKDARIKFFGSKTHARTEGKVLTIKKIGKSKKYWK